MNLPSLAKLLLGFVTLPTVAPIAICASQGDSTTCLESGRAYSGVLLATLETETPELCAALCYWTPGCQTFTYYEGSCVLLESNDGCFSKDGSVSGKSSCFINKRMSYAWHWSIRDEEKREGTSLAMTCSIPRLEKLIVTEDAKIRWMWSKEGEAPTLLSTSLVLDKTLEIPDSGKIWCELEVLGGEVLVSHNVTLNVLYLDGRWRLQPTSTGFHPNTKTLRMSCEPPLSNPPAAVEWWWKPPRGSEDTTEKPMEDSGKDFLVKGSTLFVKDPKGLTGTLRCKAVNPLTGQFKWSSRGIVTESNESAMSDETSVFTAPDVHEWNSETSTARCTLAGKTINWEPTDIYALLENSQVIVILPQNNSITVTCSGGGVSYDIVVPPAEEVAAAGMTVFTVNEGGSASQGLREELADELQLLKTQNVPSEVLDHSQLYQHVLLEDVCCDDYEIENMRGSFSLPGVCPEKLILLLINCSANPKATATARCRYSTNESVTWQLNSSSCDFSSPETAIIYNTFASSTGNVNITLFNVVLEQNTKWKQSEAEYTIESLERNLNQSEPFEDDFVSVLGVRNLTMTLLSELMSSPISMKLKTRCKMMIRRLLIVNDQGVASFSTDKMLTILWSVNFPIKQEISLSVNNPDPSNKDAAMSSSSVEIGGGGETSDTTDVAVTLPTALNEVMSGGKHNFLLNIHQSARNYAELTTGATSVSRVIDIEPDEPVHNLTRPVVFAFGLFNQTGVLTCSYYDEKAKVWSTKGMQTLGVTATGHQFCDTSHLTGFSVLFTPVPLKGFHDKLTTILTIVTCSISLVCLLLTFTALFTFRELRRNPTTKIHINLSVSLFLAILVFVVGIDRTENKLVCTCIAMVTHYLWLNVFMWMLAEAYNLYLLFVMVFPSHGSYFITKIAVPSLIIPAVIVGLTASLSFDSYTHNQYCALGTHVVYWAFVVPVCVVFMNNAVVFALVLFKIFRKGRYQKTDTKIQLILSQMRAAVTISCLLGLTWIFGVFIFKELGVVAIFFHYVFAATNTLQGVTIFIFHCVIKPDVRQKWLFVLCGIGRDLKSYPSSRAVTPALDKNRSSTGTLMTTATKRSLNRQETATSMNTQITYQSNGRRESDDKAGRREINSREEPKSLLGRRESHSREEPKGLGRSDSEDSANSQNSATIMLPPLQFTPYNGAYSKRGPGNLATLEERDTPSTSGPSTLRLTTSGESSQTDALTSTTSGDSSATTVTKKSTSSGESDKRMLRLKLSSHSSDNGDPLYNYSPNSSGPTSTEGDMTPIGMFKNIDIVPESPKNDEEGYVTGKVKKMISFFGTGRNEDQRVSKKASYSKQDSLTLQSSLSSESKMSVKFKSVGNGKSILNKNINDTINKVQVQAEAKTVLGGLPLEERLKTPDASAVPILINPFKPRSRVRSNGRSLLPPTNHFPDHPLPSCPGIELDAISPDELGFSYNNTPSPSRRNGGKSGTPPGNGISPIHFLKKTKRVSPVFGETIVHQNGARALELLQEFQL